MSMEEWSQIRDDLVLLPGPTLSTGAPTWTLQDIAAGKFYRLGWMEFEIIKRWHFCHTGKIIADIKNATLLKPEAIDVENVYKFLKASSLFKLKNSEDTQQLLQIRQAKKQGNWFKHLLKNYLFFRIPLIKPDIFLNHTDFISHMLFKVRNLYLVLFLAIIGLYLVLQDFQSFLSGFMILQSPSGLLMTFFVLAFAKIIHEFAHAMTCKYYGCRVPTMGVAFIVMWPLLWTDTTDAWRLTDRKKRLAIDGAGIIAELSLAAIASILWALSPDGTFKDAMHILAGVTWIMTLFVNLNPFMRFDGYYLLSDLLDIPNLQDRSFRLAKTKMRQSLWGIKEEKEEHFSPRLEAWLILYSYLTWIYRFFLFLGIALLVYYYFFKALGVFLMVVELWWFIARPVMNEIKYWYKNRRDMSLSLTKKITFIGLFTFFTFVIFFPWKGTLTTPAILKKEREIPLFAPSAGTISEINLGSERGGVEQKDILFTIKNEVLSHKTKTTKLELASLQKDLSNKATDPSLYRESRLIEKEVVTLSSNLSQNKAKEKELEILSPAKGQLFDVPDTLTKGTYLEKKEYMGLIVSHEFHIETFIKETDLSRLSIGAPVLFFDANNSMKTIEGNVIRIDENALAQIPYPELTSTYGGDIIMVQNQNGEAFAQSQYYKVIIKPRSQVSGQVARTGQVTFKLKPESIFYSFYKRARGILIKESNF